MSKSVKFHGKKLIAIIFVETMKRIMDVNKQWFHLHVYFPELKYFNTFIVTLLSPIKH